MEDKEKKLLEELKNKIEKFEKEISELKAKFSNHRHDGHGYTTG